MFLSSSVKFHSKSFYYSLLVNVYAKRGTFEYRINGGVRIIRGLEMVPCNNNGGARIIGGGGCLAK